MTADPGLLYLELLKRTLTRFDMEDDRRPVGGSSLASKLAARAVATALRPLQLELTRVRPFDRTARANGADQPLTAETMVGLKRLDNLQECITKAVSDGVPGDFLEAGVWRGGAAIFMRAALRVLGAEDRLVWVADSFAGLPPPAAGVEADRSDTYYLQKSLAVGLKEVKANFAKYGMDDEQVRFLQGWFSDTLPNAPIESLAVLRADGDMYSSTMDILQPLYDKVAVGGFVIIDDYGAVPACRKAVDDFRKTNAIADPIVSIDWTGVFWRKEN